jgi:hypothetical protein
MEHLAIPDWTSGQARAYGSIGVARGSKPLCRKRKLPLSLLLDPETVSTRYVLAVFSHSV